MSTPQRPLILLTNDDGIDSPGLRALAMAVAPLGDLLIAAPRQQQSGSGRAMGMLGEIHRVALDDDTPALEVWAVEGTPAMSARVGAMLLAGRPLSLAISGINYGENIGVGITVSGTVGAAMETASMGIPSLAISLETDVSHHLSYSEEIDFSASAAFAQRAAHYVLEHGLPKGVDLVKLDIPCDATPETAWKLTRLTRQRYYESTVVEEEGARRMTGYDRAINYETLEPDSDAHALLVERVVAVCPLTLDLSALPLLNAPGTIAL